MPVPAATGTVAGHRFPNKTFVASHGRRSRARTTGVDTTSLHRTELQPSPNSGPRHADVVSAASPTSQPEDEVLTVATVSSPVTVASHRTAAQFPAALRRFRGTHNNNKLLTHTDLTVDRRRSPTTTTTHGMSLSLLYHTSPAAGHAEDLNLVANCPRRRRVGRPGGPRKDYSSSSAAIYQLPGCNLSDAAGALSAAAMASDRSRLPARDSVGARLMEQYQHQYDSSSGCCPPLPPSSTAAPGYRSSLRRRHATSGHADAAALTESDNGRARRQTSRGSPSRVVRRHVGTRRWSHPRRSGARRRSHHARRPLPQGSRSGKHRPAPYPPVSFTEAALSVDHSPQMVVWQGVATTRLGSVTVINVEHWCKVP